MSNIRYGEIVAWIFIILGIATIGTYYFANTTYTNIISKIDISKFLVEYIKLAEGLSVIIMGIIYIITGILLKDKYYAGKIIALILSILFLFNFWIGTVFALFVIYTLVFSEEANEYKNKLEL